MIRFGIKIVYLQRYMTSFTDICMEKTLILQNPHWEGKTYAGLYRRQLMDNLLQKKTLPHVQILTGVRRCGKSTLFKLLINDLIEDGVSPKSILNINLDAPMFIPFWHDVSQIRLIVERAEALTGEKVEYLFLDEVQQMENWEVFVKSAYDSKEFRKIYVTGSNSNMLQSRFAAMLSGRYFENEVRPFSLRECLGTIGVRSLLDAYQRMPEVLRLINGCMAFGSFPEIVLSGLDDVLKQELLHSYFESIVQKDCIVYNSIRDSQLFYKTVNYLLRNAGNRFSPQQLAKAMNSNENTMTAYLQYLCESYICADVRNFSFSQKESKRSEHKCYCVDNGIMYANTFRYSPDTGNFFENLVFNELRNKGYAPISFDNSKGECDFIALRNGALHAFQACYELTDSNRGREFSGFSAIKASLASKVIITYHQTLEENGVRVVPLWEWALDE